MMNIIRLYIYPLFLGFVIVPLLVWPMVVALAACIITLSFLGEMLFSIPLMIRRISLLELQLWLSVVYALCPCRMRRERLIGLQNHANSIYCINHVGLISVAHQAVFLFIISLRSD